MTAGEPKVIFAPSLGTVFEWVDIHVRGWLGAVIAARVFSGFDPTTIVVATNSIHSGLRYPVVVAADIFVIGMRFVRETRGISIHADD